MNRYSNKRAFEHYLQYFVVLLLKGNESNKILSSVSSVNWIGNEVMCSFGEHRIDVVAIQEANNHVEISLIELKDEKIQDYIKYQINGYLNWLTDYILPYYLRENKTITIHPIIVSDGIPNSRNSTKQKLEALENEVINYDWSKYQSSQITISKTKIIHFNDDNGNLIF